jgi:hypothetical protein
LKNCQLCGWPEGSHHRSNQQADDYLEDGQVESDVVFRTVNGECHATVLEIARMHKTGHPVLLGTTSMEQSEALSK